MIVFLCGRKAPCKLLTFARFLVSGLLDFRSQDGLLIGTGVDIFIIKTTHSPNRYCIWPMPVTVYENESTDWGYEQILVSSYKSTHPLKNGFVKYKWLRADLVLLTVLWALWFMGWQGLNYAFKAEKPGVSRDAAGIQMITANGGIDSTLVTTKPSTLASVPGPVKLRSLHWPSC